ncbi:inner membrane-spanning protein YciB [Stagnihabitans tardus]|uniref:Inner membrane-spanning protein YciB n=1 Tax=Stagnihabitans tardus TaxID=2699202 RepID=A0AAE4YCK0_9RHOB|nr:inner membrane-spanning protein YciB [Stagnihabitans tardus]NBZ88946.1 septation protein A [Stagnihabitans tardus]
MTKMKAVLEYGPLVVFLAAYVLLKDQTMTWGGVTYTGFILTTGIFVVLQTAATLALWKLTGKLSAMQLLTLAVVLFMGGLTVWFNDGHFIKMKPTIIYIFFAGLLGIGLLRGQSWLKLVMGEHLPMAEEGWLILTRRICVFFLAMAVLNEIVWRNFSDGTWLTFKVVGLTVAMFGFLLSQAKLLQKYGQDKD